VFRRPAAAEKALKAVLVQLGVAVPKTHFIGYLLDLIEGSGRIAVPESVRDAIVLTDYAVSTRHPGDWEPVDETEYEHARALADCVYRWAAGIIGEEASTSPSDDT